MKKMYKDPKMEILLLVRDEIMASDDEELEGDDYEGGLPGWNGDPIVLPPMPIVRN